MHAIANFFIAIWNWCTRFMGKKSHERFTPFVLHIEEVIDRTPGRRHAWFKSNIGNIRKPIADL